MNLTKNKVFFHCSYLRKYGGLNPREKPSGKTFYSRISGILFRIFARSNGSAEKIPACHLRNRPPVPFIVKIAGTAREISNYPKIPSTKK